MQDNILPTAIKGHFRTMEMPVIFGVEGKLENPEKNHRPAASVENLNWRHVFDATTVK